MLLLSYLRTLFTASLIAVAIVACDGSSGGASSGGAETTLGVANMDIDNNGVRDDVQAVIDIHSGDDETKSVVLMRRAIIEQQMLTSARDIEKLTALAAMLSKEYMCSPDAFSRLDEKIEFELDYYEVFYNNSSRRDAHEQVEAALSSIRVPSATPSDCD